MKLCCPKSSVCLFSLSSLENKESSSIYFVCSVDEDLSPLIKNLVKKLHNAPLIAFVGGYLKGPLVSFSSSSPPLKADLSGCPLPPSGSISPESEIGKALIISELTLLGRRELDSACHRGAVFFWKVMRIATENKQ